MARSSSPDSANSQFFICFTDAGFLDGQYTVWGEVESGMEHVDALPTGEPVAQSGQDRQSDRRLTNAVTLITGASAGLGADFARQCVGAGRAAGAGGAAQGRSSRRWSSELGNARAVAMDLGRAGRRGGD